MGRFSRFDHTGSDYDSVLADIKARLATTFSDWTDTSIANDGMSLTELVAYIADNIRYYQDKQSNENFLITAFERSNIIWHLKMIGYRLSTAAPATAALVASFPAQTSPVVFEKGDVFLLADGSVQYEIGVRTEAPTGTTGANFDVVEGKTIDEALGASDGTADQKCLLGQTPYIFDSQEVTVDGITWTRVDDFLNSSSADQHYVVDVDAEDQATVIFGDGTNGAKPATGTQLAATYRIGGGKIGNVDANLITKAAKSYTNTAGGSVKLTVTNPAKASGGDDRETEAHAKIYGPKSLATGSRSVSSGDFETNAELVVGVARALAQTVDDDPIINEGTTLLQIVPVGSGVPTQLLLDAVKLQVTVTKPKTNCARVMVVPALYIDISPVGTVYLDKGESQQSLLQSRVEEVADAVIAALALRYDAQHIDVTAGRHTANFGARQALSTLYRTIDDVDGVDFTDLTSPVADTILAQKYFPRLRTYVRTVVLAATYPTVKVLFTWDGLGTALVVQEAP